MVHIIQMTARSTNLLQTTARSTGSTGLPGLLGYRSTGLQTLQTLQNSTDDYQVYRLYHKFLSLLMNQLNPRFRFKTTTTTFNELPGVFRSNLNNKIILPKLYNSFYYD
jgi:hypothetical protein